MPAEFGIYTTTPQVRNPPMGMWTTLILRVSGSGPHCNLRHRDSIVYCDIECYLSMTPNLASLDKFGIYILLPLGTQSSRWVIRAPRWRLSVGSVASTTASWCYHFPKGSKVREGPKASFLVNVGVNASYNRLVDNIYMGIIHMPHIIHGKLFTEC